MKMGSEGTRSSSGHNLMDKYNRVMIRASDDKVCASKHDNSVVKNFKPMNFKHSKSMVYDDINSTGFIKKKEGMDLTVKPKKLVIGGNNTFASKGTKIAHLMTMTQKEALMYSRDIKGNRRSREGLSNHVFDMLDALKEGRLKDLECGYEVGDMVWGKVKSHPWWPGQVLDEAFASASVCNTKKEGHILVAFYGDNTYRWLKPVELVPFDSRYTKKSKQTNNQAFLAAVEEAKDEVSKRAALGLTCCCRKPNNFCLTNVQGFFKVDVSGFEPSSVYALKQIESARDGFQPCEMLSFVKTLALMPQNKVHKNVKWMKTIAHLLAYRRAVFEEFDETYAQAFGAQTLLPRGSSVILNDTEEAPLQGIQDMNLLAKPISCGLSMKKKREDLVEKEIGNASHPIENARDHLAASKPLKKRFKPFEANKDHASYPEEEKSIRRSKEWVKMKSSVSKQKEGNQKPLQLQGNEKMVVGRLKPKKLAPKTLEGYAEPTTLVMKFPPRSALPSISELKAKFICFGTLDESGTRAFRESSSCHVVFNKLSSAQEAYHHAVQNRTLFGNMKVNYSLKALKVSTLKSGLKKLSDDEKGSINSVNNNTPPATKKSYGSIAGNCQNPISPWSTEINDKVVNFHEVIPPTLSPQLSLPSHHNMSETNVKSIHNAKATTDNIDISEQMLDLLKKCSDIVADLMSPSA